jgi:hypothetical protein
MTEHERRLAAAQKAISHTMSWSDIAKVVVEAYNASLLPESKLVTDEMMDAYRKAYADAIDRLGDASQAGLEAAMLESNVIKAAQAWGQWVGFSHLSSTGNNLRNALRDAGLLWDSNDVG